MPEEALQQLDGKTVERVHLDVQPFGWGDDKRTQNLYCQVDR